MGTMTFVDAFFSREHRYALGIEEQSGRAYLSIPVSTGPVDYEEYYELAPDEYERFLGDPAAAIAFAGSCRLRLRDDLLILQPGWNRGTAI